MLEYTNEWGSRGFALSNTLQYLGDSKQVYHI